MNKQTQEIAVIKQEVDPLAQRARTMQVTNAETYSFAAEFLKETKAAHKKAVEFFAPMKQRTHAAWKEVCAREKQVLDPLRKAETTLKGRMLSWESEQEEIAKQQAAKLQAEADARAAKERARLEKEAEKLKTPELKEQRLAEAEAVEAPVVSVQTEQPKVAGISTKTTWKVRILDKDLFIKSAHTHPACAHLKPFCIIDEKALNRVAQATKGEVQYPGIEFYQEKSMAAKAE